MKVSIRIPDPILRCYIRSSYDVTDDNYVAITSNTITGGVINTVVKATTLKPEEFISDEIVACDLSLSYYTAIHRHHFLTIDSIGELQINNVLRHEFDTTLLNFCNLRIRRGDKLKEAILDFMSLYGLIDDANYEALKKRYYRAQTSFSKSIYTTLRKKYYRLSQKFEKK